MTSIRSPDRRGRQNISRNHRELRDAAINRELSIASVLRESRMYYKIRRVSARASLARNAEKEIEADRRTQMRFAVKVHCARDID